MVLEKKHGFYRLTYIETCSRNIVCFCFSGPVVFVQDHV